MRHVLFLAAFATITIASCDMLELPQAESKNDGKIFLTNPKNMEGTYTTTGPHGFFYRGQVLKVTSQGEYQIVFINSYKVDDNICWLDGTEPVFIGKTTFIADEQSQTYAVSVPAEEISCYLHFNTEKSVKLSDILLKGVSNKIFTDGDFVDSNPTMKLMGSSYVIAAPMEISIGIQLVDEHGATQEIKVLKTTLNAKPRHQYSIRVGEDEISVSSN